VTDGRRRGGNGRYILTGGPGAGKTTLLEALSRCGFATVPESARAVIAGRLARGLSPRPEPIEFAQTILARDMANYRDAPDVAIFDRSMVDALGMLFAAGAVTRVELADFLERYPYNRTAFLLPPWQAIYHPDAERDQTYEESVAVFESISRWYAECGYRTVEVPKAAVAERVRFVERIVAAQEGSE
jgi:predicted ATPase